MQYCSDTMLFSVLWAAFTAKLYQHVRLIMQSYIKVVLSDDYKTDADSWKEMNKPRFIFSQIKSKQYNKYVIFPDFLKEQ